PLDEVVVAVVQKDSRVVAEVTYRQTAHSAAAGFNVQTTNRAGCNCQAIELDERCAGVPWLGRPIDNHRVCDVRQCIQQSNGLHSWSRNVEDDRVFADGRVCVNDGIAQRSGAVIVRVRYHKTLSRRGEVRGLICTQGVECLTRWSKIETD